MKNITERRIRKYHEILEDIDFDLCVVFRDKD
jgi:hypothetical protein